MSLASKTWINPILLREVFGLSKDVFYVLDEVQNSPINSISDPGVRRSGRGTKRSRDDSSDEGDDLENEG